MARLVEFLADDDLLEIAGYFAALDLPVPPSAADPTPPAPPLAAPRWRATATRRAACRPVPAATARR